MGSNTGPKVSAGETKGSAENEKSLENTTFSRLAVVEISGIEPLTS